MIPLLACLLTAEASIGQAPIGHPPMDQAPRLRTQLPNGALILIDRVPKAKLLVMDLFVSSRGTEDAPGSQGRRHLLEHLVALGPDGKLDTRLETAGGLLTARTLRECTEFDLVLPPDGLKTGIAALKELLAPPQIDAAAITREATIIDEEGAIREDPSRASAAAWESVFGPSGLDPFGDRETMWATTADDLNALRRRSFAANHLAVVVSGDVELDSATRSITDVLSLLPSVSEAKGRAPVDPNLGHCTAEVRGEYRGVVVSGVRSPKTAATLAAALALSVDVPGGDVVYTPSAHPGLVLLGTPDGKLDERIAHANAAALFTLGRLSAIRWVNAQMSEPQSAASFRGMLIVSERDLRPETMIENLNALQFEDFKDAVEAFKSHCVTVEGTR
jgi:hypothetical protein